jgi:hypothetical protein
MRTLHASDRGNLSSKASVLWMPDADRSIRFKHSFFECRMPNLLVTHFNSSRSLRAAIQMIIFDKALE